jgi:aspartate/methionine/tyrosine aminotransferase
MEPDDPVVVISGFSKAWAVMSECYNTGAVTIVQFDAMAALEKGEPFVRDMVKQYTGGRDMVMEMLGAHPRIEMLRPGGACYAFPRIRGIADSNRFAERLADEKKVGLAPGYTFGPGNEEYVRICFALSHDRLREALSRIVRFVDRYED